MTIEEISNITKFKEIGPKDSNYVINYDQEYDNYYLSHFNIMKKEPLTLRKRLTRLLRR